jgi:hypothetical protein
MELFYRRSYYYYYYYYYYFVINVLLGSKSCPSTLDIIGLRVPTRNLRDFSLFHVSSYKNCPSGRCVTAANCICNNMDVFRREFVTLREM